MRAFNPVPGAWFEANGERIKLLEAAVGNEAPHQPGEVLDDRLNIACWSGLYPRRSGPARGARADGPGRAAARLSNSEGHDPAVTRWRLTIEYDGGPFMGWQRQDHGPSVQQTLEEALRADDRRADRRSPRPAGPTPESTRWP